MDVKLPDPILAFPLGMPEMIILFVLILLLFGAKRLPTLARSIGKSLGEFRKAKDEFQEELTRGEDEGAKEYEQKKARPRPRQIPADAAKSATDAVVADKEKEADKSESA